MPKRVDHDQRRRDIVEAAWRLIARGGFEAMTMREIAAEAGFANGALKYYFSSKDELLAAAFQQGFFRVNERASHSIQDRTGLDAIRLLCLEMLPLDAERQVEARVAVAFWDRVVASKALMKIHADSVAIWRKWMEDELDTARRSGRLETDLPDQQIIDALFFVTTGMRVLPILEQGFAPPETYVDMLDTVLQRIVAPRG
ncbi:MAG: TetR/AcrR family transcriptional regulator [Actinomycetota bacterium]|nr:TetR/AcrR family transcriptional regulator [Actinomycetota bacterium]MDQ2697397.1 TetR/AcrR family transcriptional regulator [Actinomycetota bacterium]